ncbi:MAG: endonuclease VIII [Gammaproteobacteria bacterium]
MPEGPEIRRAADRIGKVLVGERLEEVYFAFDALRERGGELDGVRVEAVDTRGKAMLTRFSNGLTLYSHNQLYGRWYTRRRGQWPQTRRSLRVALHTSTHSALLYSASDVDLLDAEGLAGHPFLSRIGPDILDPDLTAAAVEARLLESRFRRRSLAALYLDQAFLAGLGNYLRSEILHRAGLHPRRRPGELADGQLQGLAAETLAVARRSYRTGGVTLTDAAARRAGPRADGRRRRFYVFSRAGRPCLDCGAAVLRENFGSRRLYYCPRCQPEAAGAT